MELSLIKLANGTLAPADEASNEELAKVKTGVQMHGTFTRQRNAAFHRKFFALIGIGFDMWCEFTPSREYKGETIAPSKDEFRSNVTILAGYYTTTFDINGGLHLRAKSIRFAAMDQDEFQTLYSKVIDVLLTKVLTNRNITERALRDHVERVLAFDS